MRSSFGMTPRPTRLVVGEIKTYPDRAGYTDSAELATARAQAGVYVHGLDLVIEELGLAERFDVAREGFLVLTRPGFNQPSIRAGEDLALSGGDGLSAASPCFGPRREPYLRPDGRDRLAAVILAETHYCENCVSRSAIALTCVAEMALESGLGRQCLGDDVARFLGSVSLPRALELMQGAEPLNPARARPRTAHSRTSKQLRELA